MSQLEDEAYDERRVAELALAVLYVSMGDDGRAWKGIPWSITDRLFEQGLIENPRNQLKSLKFTRRGKIRCQEAFRRHVLQQEVKPEPFPEPVFLDQNQDSDLGLVLDAGQHERVVVKATREHSAYLNLRTGEVDWVESILEEFGADTWLKIPTFEKDSFREALGAFVQTIENSVIREWAAERYAKYRPETFLGQLQKRYPEEASPWEAFLSNFVCQKVDKWLVDNHIAWDVTPNLSKEDF
jgi:Domain of unknown function (DUF6429)